MKVTKKDLGKSQIELTVEISADEFRPYALRGAEKVSEHVKVEGFRPGKAPYDILKRTVGEMTILEEAAHLVIEKTVDQAVQENITGQIVGQPQVNVTKLAPDNPMEYKIIVSLLPEVKLGQYKDLKIKQAEAAVKDEEVEKIISELREMRGHETVAESPVKEGDRVTMDIDIFVDKIPVESGRGKDASVLIGKDYVIPGFDKNILGLKKGESKEFSLLYPAEYHDKSLAGKMAEFVIKIKEVYNRVLPEVNDDFAKGFGLKSPVELRENIKKSLAAEKEQEEIRKSDGLLMDKIIAASKFGDIPEMLIKHEAEVMMSELEYNVKSQGGKFEDYLMHLNKTKDQIMLDMMPDAVKRVKVSLIVREVAGLQKISVSHEEIHKVIDDIARQYQGNAQALERLKGHAYHDYVENNLTGKKVMEKLREWNVVK